jgi:hypothetical protein
MTVEGGVKKMKIARIISCELDSTLRPTYEARIWYHSGFTAGIDMIGNAGLQLHSFLKVVSEVKIWGGERMKKVIHFSFFIIPFYILDFRLNNWEWQMTIMIWIWHTVAFLFQSGIWSKKMRRRKNEKAYSFFILHHFVGRVWLPWVRSTNLYLKKSIITKLDCRSGIIPAPIATPDRGKTSRAQDQITKISTMLT